MPLVTRINERYASSLHLAELILHATSIDAATGSIAASAFVFDMNKVFEDFVTAALREAALPTGPVLRAQWRGWLDQERRLAIQPDLTWWDGTTCLAVADAKYKALEVKGLPNADAYQILAYCTALGLERGFLIYASDEGDRPRRHSVRGGRHVIEVRALDIRLEPTQLLAGVGILAREIRSTSSWSSPQGEVVAELAPSVGGCSPSNPVHLSGQPSTSRGTRATASAGGHT